MSWRTPVDLYCERNDPGLWAEPLNALTNLAFIAAGLWLIARSRQAAALPDLGWLGALIVSIGLGSGAFHLFAERWAEVADVAAITVTLLVYVVLWLRRVMGVPWHWAWLGVPGFLGWSAAIAVLVPPSALNGSGGYAPPLLALLLFAALQAWRGRPGAGYLVAAAAAFLVSLSFRSVDLALCAQWPYGTHFVWHLLNALTLTLAALALTNRGPAHRP